MVQWNIQFKIGHFVLLIMSLWVTQKSSTVNPRNKVMIATLLESKPSSFLFDSIERLFDLPGTSKNNNLFRSSCLIYSRRLYEISYIITYDFKLAIPTILRNLARNFHQLVLDWNHQLVTNCLNPSICQAWKRFSINFFYYITTLQFTVECSAWKIKDWP